MCLWLKSSDLDSHAPCISGTSWFVWTTSFMERQWLIILVHSSKGRSLCSSLCVIIGLFLLHCIWQVSLTESSHKTPQGDYLRDFCDSRSKAHSPQLASLHHLLYTEWYSKHCFYEMTSWELHSWSHLQGLQHVNLLLFHANITCLLFKGLGSVIYIYF